MGIRYAAKRKARRKHSGIMSGPWEQKLRTYTPTEGRGR